MGGGKGKGKGKGKNSWGGCGPYERAGPVLEQPPAYPPEKMLNLTPIDLGMNREDCLLINAQRNVLSYLVQSPFQGDAQEDNDGSGKSHPGPAAKNVVYAGSGNSGVKDIDNVMRELFGTGGTNPSYFPMELCTKQLLRARAGLSHKSLLESLRRIEGKEKQKGEGGNQDKKDDSEKKGDDQEMEEESDDDDDDFGGEDYGVEHGDFEDGMGNDFDDDGGGGAGDD